MGANLDTAGSASRRRRADPASVFDEHRATRRWPILAAFLSFLWPGLGQAYASKPRNALVQALPPAIVTGLVVLLLIVIGPIVLLLHLLNPVVALLAGLLIVAFAVWRVFAIVHAGHVAASGTPASPATALTVLVLALVVVLMHGWAASVVWSTFQAGQRIAQPLAVPGADAIPTHSPETPPTSAPGSARSYEPGTPPPTVAPGSQPHVSSATPAPPSPLPGGRITVLFLGRDLGTGAEGLLTDSLQVASFDPQSGRIVMIALPRDTGMLPLYNGGTWPHKINALMSYAETHPSEFPEGGLTALRRQVSHVIGIPIHYHASVDLDGFVRLVDVFGGVDVTVERAIADDDYWLDGQRGFYLQPGEHHLDGKAALAYVRSRHGPGNSDFQRARRQQQVLLALRHKIDDPQVIANLPAAMDAAAEMIRTDAPLDRLPEILTLLQASTDASVERHVLQPPDFAEVIPKEEVGGQYMTRLKMEAVAQLSIDLFGEESSYYQQMP